MAGVIVVGVDGSDHGRAALRFAVEEARLRGATLVAAHAWTYVPPAPIAEPGMVPLPPSDFEGAMEAGRGAARAELERALQETPAEGLDVEPRLVEGDPGGALVELSQGADLVVVGTRGRGGLATAVLGSVSHHVVQHAHCPVVVVRARA